MMLKLLVSLSTLVICQGISFTHIGDDTNSTCVATLSDNSKFDLTALQNETKSSITWTDEDGTFTYTFQACGTHNCGGNPSSLCQHSNQFQDDTNLAIWLGGSADQGLFSRDGKDLEALFRNGDSCGLKPRNTTFQLNCNKSADTPVLKSVAEKPTCVYTAIIDTSAACPGAPQPGMQGGLSLGSIILIVLFSVLFVYLVVGFIWNKRKQEEGGSCMDNIPNIDMWRAVPGMAKDGCKFCVSKMRGCCNKGGGGSGEFEAIE